MIFPELPQAVLWTLAGIFAVLVLASLTVSALGRLRP